MADCSPCPGGKYCNESGLSGPTGPCAAGYFCVNAAYTDEPQDYDNFTSGDCLCPANSTGGECQEGFFCPQGSHEPTACTGGFYCAGKGRDAVTAECDAGWFCTSGAKVPRPSDGITGDICPPGRYCPKGTKVPQLCPIGTYSNNTGNSHQDNCTACREGSYCETRELTKPTALCSAKYYCPAGESIDKRLSCTKGHFCREGSPQPVHCPSGTYQDELQQDYCKTCPAGHYCDSKDDLSDFTPYPCPNGYYCPNGTRYATEFGCPNGTHGNGTQLFHPDQCVKCPPGKFCYGKMANGGGSMSSWLTFDFSPEFSFSGQMGFLLIMLICSICFCPYLLAALSTSGSSVFVPIFKKANQIEHTLLPCPSLHPLIHTP